MTEAVPRSVTRVSEETVGLPTPKTVETGAGPVAQHGSRRDGRRRPSSRRRSRRSDVRLLNGRYELDRTLGAGGMGTVFRAVDHRLGRPVAVKMLHEGRRGTEGFRRRLAAEAAIAAALHHRSVAQIYDYDEDGSSRDRAPFVVMELVDGVTLSQYVRRHGPLTVPQTLAVVQQIAGALAHLEAHDVVHRDLKPANVMLATDSRVILLDFGIAHTPSSETLTTTGAILGTVEYVSPELIGGESATRASDLYALGLIAHHCLTGESPFTRSSPIATAFAQIHDPAPDLPPTVPEPVREIVTSLVAKKPSQRPDSARDVLRAIAPYAAAADLPPVSDDDVAGVLSAVPTDEEHTPPRQRVLGRLLVAAAMVPIACLMTSAMQIDGSAGGEDRVVEVEPIPAPGPAPDATSAGPVPVVDEPVDRDVVVPTAAVTEPRNAHGVRNSNGKASNNNGRSNGVTQRNANGNANGQGGG